MIFDTLAHTGQYLALHPLFSAAFDYLKAFDPATPDGKYFLDGERLFASVQRYTTAPAETKAWESHRVYADIQCLFSGSECLFHAPVECFPSGTPYNDLKDVLKYGTEPLPGESLSILRPGYFCVYFPQDAHKPGCLAQQAGPVMKVVMKVRLRD